MKNLGVFRSVALSAIPLLATLGVAVATSPAGAHVSATHAAANTNTAGTLLPSTIASRISSGNLSDVSIADLASVGITPGMSPSDGSPPLDITEGYTPQDQASPNSHYGCNGTVCINVIGTKLFVNEWDTTAYTNDVDCTLPLYLKNDKVYATGYTICADPPVTYYSNSNPERSFADGTNLCNEWTGIDGKPCAKVHD